MSDKTMLKYYDSLNELFEDTNLQPQDYQNFYCNNRGVFDRTHNASGSGFNGNQKKIYEKFKNHNVKQEAGIMDGIINDLNLAEFKEHGWEFRQRLEEGDFVDVERYLEGHERFWSGVRRVLKTKQVIRVYLTIGGHAGRSAEELAICGAAAVTVCEVLESMGVGTELWVASGSNDLIDHYTGNRSKKYDNIYLAIRAKNSNEFADLGMINFICGNHHVFRCTIFRAWALAAQRLDIDTYSSLGQPAILTKDSLGLEGDEVDTSVIIPAFYSITQAREWLSKFFNKVKEGGDK